MGVHIWAALVSVFTKTANFLSPVGSFAQTVGPFAQARVRA